MKFIPVNKPLLSNEDVASEYEPDITGYSFEVTIQDLLTWKLLLDTFDFGIVFNI